MFNILNVFAFFKKNFSKKDIYIIFGLIVLYFTTRLIRLEQFPIFTDEGIYIHWAKVAWHDASMRFISLTDGKQPLQTWATIPFLKLFPNNPLFAGRLFSVMTGFLSLIGIFSILFYLFNKKTAQIGSLLYILTPYFLFYDRMALTDSAVNMGFIWILFFSLVLVRTISLDIALIFGLVGGLALLTKSSAQMFILLAGLAPIIILKDGLKKNILKIVNYYLLFFIVLIYSFVIYNIQRLSPYLHYVGIKNTTFLMTPQEFLQAPFSMFCNNFKGVIVDIVWEAGWFLPILGVFGLITLYKKNRTLFYYLLSWFVLPFLVICSISKIIFPRYLIFFASLLVVWSAIFIADLKLSSKKNLLIVFVIFMIFFDYKIIFDFKNISFPPVDRGQYIEGPPAGWGVAEIIDYSRKKATEKPVVLLAEGNFGLIGDMLDASLGKNDTNITVQGYWPLELSSLLENQSKLENNYVYVVFPHRTEFPQSWPNDRGGPITVIFFSFKIRSA